jgi:formylmethanofuran dehydrogenase subunit E
MENNKSDFLILLAEAEECHGDLCDGQIIGVRIALPLPPLQKEGWL